ncbi:hypothetical protein GLAREA_05489 [Glarea lozoyensis ATCC 20868]|uniref:Uncharacterized protein n=1 Tax=Glarea lozoyensis (strain ATCC 20868 / MF5171) TaxID=1116229 RepID=S3DW21_GLAL2|nr:uncharacterized protein GLAREA_05489 [Glarea lozoyensis ATCC 20868]EPE36151.1 hypothetical protein GLAREA_05489 [Glarea lozoyensis ATCC 20868]
MVCDKRTVFDGACYFEGVPASRGLGVVGHGDGSVVVVSVVERVDGDGEVEEGLDCAFWGGVLEGVEVVVVI